MGGEVSPLAAARKALGFIRPPLPPSAGAVFQVFAAALAWLRRLTYSHIGIYYLSMSRAATTTDIFNAIAEARRREILELLVEQERSVSDLVDQMGLEQPSVSKHLRVLRDVDLVRVRRDGRQMLYRTHAEAIKPLHDWASGFERYWSQQLRRIKDRAEKNDRINHPLTHPNRSKSK
jgi:DNA-binding transcriptional ArsR family regulator